VETYGGEAEVTTIRTDDQPWPVTDDLVGRVCDEDERERVEGMSAFLLSTLVAALPARAPIPELTANGLAPAAAQPWRAESPTCAHGSAQPQDQRSLALRVDAGELGTISIVVQRGADGMQLVLAVDNPAAEAAACLERHALQESLRAAGVHVNQVSIVRTGPAGIVLADNPAGMRFVKTTTLESEPAQNDFRNVRRGFRRLDTTG
jgi:hypothetical protein